MHQINGQGNGQGPWIAYKKIKFLISPYINKKCLWIQNCSEYNYTQTVKDGEWWTIYLI